MEVILIEEVPNLGNIGELVRVKPGYARNFLLPRKLAIGASIKNKKKLEHDQKVAGYRLAKAKEEAQGVAKKLSGLSLTIARRVGEQDKLFGSVTTHDIQHALEEKGLKVDRRKLQLSEPIKALGTFKVAVKLQTDVSTELTVNVVAEA